MNNLSFKRKLGTVSILVLSTFILILFIFYKTMSKSNTQMEVIHCIDKLEKDILQLRKHEKDFIIRKNLKYKASFQKVHSGIEDDIQMITDFVVKEGLSSDELSSFGITVKEYKKLFFEFIDSQVKIGLDPKTGLYGSLRKSVHNAEYKIGNFADYKLKSDMLMLRRREKDFMLRRDPKYIDKFRKDYDKMIVNISESKLVPSSEKPILKGLMEDYKRDFIALYKAEVNIGLSHTEGIQGKMRETVHRTDTQLSKLSENLNSHFSAEIKSAEKFMYILLLISSAFTGGLVLYIANSIVSRLKDFNSIMKELASGEADLTKRIDFKGKDELVELSGYFNKFIKNLRGLFTGIVDSAEQISDENSRIASTVEEFNATFREQSIQTSSVAAAMEEMSASSATVSEVIVNMENNTNMAKEKVKEGAGMLKKSVGVINEINEKTSKLRETVTSLTNSSNQIGEIISSINDIADQTNLLALNAAIEAARAGEAGRGFAVVADEVRKLAERTQLSIKEITDIITELRNETNRTSIDMQDANDKVEEGVLSVSETGVVFNELVGIVDEMIASNDTVATSVSEQVSTVQEVSMNTQAISSGVEQSAATVNEISESTNTLSSSASELKQQMAKFTV